MQELVLLNRVLAEVYGRKHKRFVAPAPTASHAMSIGPSELSSSQDAKYGREAIGFHCKVVEQRGVAQAEAEAVGYFRSCPAQLWIADEQTRLPGGSPREPRLTTPTAPEPEPRASVAPLAAECTPPRWSGRRRWRIGRRPGSGRWPPQKRSKLRGLPWLFNHYKLPAVPAFRRQ